MRTKTGVMGMALLLATASVQAATPVYDSGNFDTPSRFTPGPLQGQDAGLWINFGDGSATVENTVRNTGIQAVQLTHGTGSSLWNPTTSAFHPSGNTHIVRVRWSEMVPNSTATNEPIYGIEAYDSDGDQLATIGLDATDGHLYSRNPDLSVVDLGSAFTATKGTWYSFELDLDYSTNKFTTLINSTVRDANRPFFSAPSDFSDADLWLSAKSSSATTTGSGFIDDYVVDAVPEPAGLGLFVVAGAGLLTRRFRSRGRSPSKA